jgi:hypothetical protein
MLEEVGATVVWVKDDSAGLKFAEAIDPEAARSRTIVPPIQKPALTPDTVENRGNTVDRVGRRVGAGWIAELNDPYRK